MTLVQIELLLDYHYWARNRLMAALAAVPQAEYVRPRGSSFSSIRETMLHAFGAEWLWFSRWEGRSPTSLPIGEDLVDVKALEGAWRQLEADVRTCVSTRGEAGLLLRVDYRNLAGQPVSSVLWHMVQHVVNHATYHRGQVTTMLRQAGLEPPEITDLMVFYRESGL
jgi:uncharacterized damage-inducible protein DinB